MSNFEKNLFINFPSVLFAILPLLMITGPFLSDLSISLISIIFLIYSVKKKDFTFFKNIFFFVFILFCTYIFFNGLLQGSDISSLKSTFFYFRFGIFACAVVFLLNQNPKSLKFFYFVIILCFCALIIDAFIQYIFTKNIFNWSMGLEKNRISSFFGDELIMGSYLSKMTPILIAIYFYFKKESNNFNVLNILFISLLIITVFISGERSSFFLLNLSLLFTIFFIKNLRKTYFFIIFFSFLAITLVTYFNPSAKLRMIDLTISQTQLFKSKEFSILNLFSKQHNDHYNVGLKIFKDNKFFGVGVKNFKVKCQEKKYKVSEISCSTHPHNIYIQFLSEIGLIGLLFVLFFIFHFLKIFFQTFKKDRYNKSQNFIFDIAILSGIFSSIWPFIPSGNFFNNWLSINYFLPIALLIWSRRKKIYEFI